MKFYLVKIQKSAEGTTQGVYAYDTFDAALAAFHTELAYRSDSRLATVCVILDDYGNTQKKESWSAAPAED